MSKDGADNSQQYPDVAELIIDNFIEVIKRIPMKHSDRIRIIRLIDLCIKHLGKDMTADAIYPEEDSDPSEYDYEWEMVDNEEI